MRPTASLIGFVALAAVIGLSTGCTGIKTHGVADVNLPSDVARQKIIDDTDFWGTMGAFFSSEQGENSLEQRMLSVQQQAEENANKVPDEAFIELAPEAARWLARTLPRSPASEGPTKNILVFQNSKFPDTPEGNSLRAAADELRVNMINSDVLQGLFVFLSEDDQAGNEAIQKATNNQPIAVFDPLGNNNQPAAYPPSQVYVIKTKFNKTTDANAQKLTYRLTVTLNKPMLRRDFTSKTFSKNFFYQPYRQMWISAEENGRLQETYQQKVAENAQK